MSNTLLVSITSEGQPQHKQKHRSSADFGTESAPSGTEQLLFMVDPTSNPNYDQITFKVKQDISLWPDPDIYKNVGNNTKVTYHSHRKLYIADPENTGGQSFTVIIYAVS